MNNELKKLKVIFAMLLIPYMSMSQSVNSNWWKNTFVYQIYPRSFKDSNGDGIGDLKGITSKLDYLKTLGVETVWLSPFYKSPMDDMGYDISNYYEVDPMFGSMADFDEMLSEMKKRNIRLVIDLVVNHCSDEHDWFKQARQSKDNPYHNYFIWKAGKKGEAPNNWQSVFGGSAWEWNEATQEYYLHMFTKKQPDLNWENPELRNKIYSMMNFWLDKGVDGFRMDVITMISKDQRFPDVVIDKKTGKRQESGIITNGPRVHEYLREMNDKVLKNRDIYTVGEGADVSRSNVLDYVLPSRGELQTIYHFEHMFIDRKPNFLPKKFEPMRLKQVFTEWNNTLSDKAPNTIYLGNHDQVRSISRFGNDEKYWNVSGKMLALLLFTNSNIPYFIQGDEMGMTNVKFKNIDEIRDVATINVYKAIKKWYIPSKALMNIVNKVTRDHSRTPFQWNNSTNAGFTEGNATWLKVNENFTTINAEKAMADANSIWHFYQKLVATRKASPALSEGKFEDLLPNDPNIYCYTRTAANEKWMVVLNLTAKQIKHKIEYKKEQVTLSNYADELPNTLRAYECKLISLKSN
jgi:oligo-1,6-glucosidase